MDDPTQQQGQGGKGSLEDEPSFAPENAEAEQRIEVRRTSARGRTDISLENLEKRADRNYDAETPKLINEINFTESAEAQKERLKALAFVSVQMIAQILARNPDIEKKIDLEKFENIPLLKKYFDSIYPKAAENAAMHKLGEMRDNIGADVSIVMKEKWPEIVDIARETSKEMKSLLAADFKKEHPEKGEDGFISKSVEFAKNHEILTAGIALAGAYGIYKLWNRMFPGKEEKKDEKTAEEGKEGEKKEPEKKEGGFLKWIVGAGIAIGGIFGLGRLLGSDGVKKWIKDKFGWNISGNRITEALAYLSKGEFTKAAKTIWEGVDENADFHNEIAEIINKDMNKKVSGKTIFQLKDEKFKEFTEWYAGSIDDAVLSASEKAEESGGILKQVASLLTGSSDEIKEKIVVRDFLKKHDKKIHEIMAVNDQTTVGMVLKEIYTDKTGKSVPTPESEKQTADNSPSAPLAVVPPAVQATIEKNYSPEEQKEIHQLSAHAFGNKEIQQKEIFGENGLMEKLKILAEKDPSYKEKTNNLNRLTSELEEKRRNFLAALTEKKPVAELKKIAEEIKKSEEGLEETAAAYYEEIRAKMPGWAPLPFLAYRYTLFTSRERAALRENIRRAVVSPFKISIDEIQASKNPIPFFEGKHRQAVDELEAYERARSLAPDGREAIKNTPTLDKERHAKIRRVEMFEKRLAWEKLKVDPKTPADILLKAQREYLETFQGSFKANISYLKDVLPKEGATISDRQKVEMFHDVQQEKRVLRQSLNNHLQDIKRAGDKLDAKALSALTEEGQKMLDAYKATVAEELSLWRKLVGESRGLRKAFIEWVREENGRGFVKFVRNKFGRISVVGLMLAPTLYFKYKNIKEKNPQIAIDDLVKELGMDSVQLLADVCPFTFGGSDWYTVWKGEELITRRKVGGWDRYSRVIWGCLGTLLDAATLIPAIDVAGAPANAIMRLARTAGKIKEGRKIIRMWPMIKRAAESVGGWKKFAQYLAEYHSTKGAAKLAPAARMVQVAAPRLAIPSVLIGGVAYNAIYTKGDDINDPGEEFTPDVTAELQGEPAS